MKLEQYQSGLSNTKVVKDTAVKQTPSIHLNLRMATASACNL